MATDTDQLSATKRKLIFRDSLTFLSLLSITALLFTLTLLLFRSFESHRSELAIRWAERGRLALQSGQPVQAISAYRTALSYAPSERGYELQLAQALGAAGRVEESYNYFAGLWESRPGDGFINLQLARLATKKKSDEQSAINFYRASIYGTWEGDGVERRRMVRLELAQYLIDQQDPAAAKAELLIAGGNAPNTPQTDLTLARMLDRASDPTDAYLYYQKAITLDPKNVAALEDAGKLAFAMGRYAQSQRWLERAVRTGMGDGDDTRMLAQVERLEVLDPASTHRARERVARTLALRSIAKKRLDACQTSLLPTALTTRWSGAAATANAAALLADPDTQEATLQLAYDTQIEAAPICGMPSGDDTLALLLAQNAEKQTPVTPDEVQHH